MREDRTWHLIKMWIFRSLGRPGVAIFVYTENDQSWYSGTAHHVGQFRAVVWPLELLSSINPQGTYGLQKAIFNYIHSEMGDELGYSGHQPV